MSTREVKTAKDVIENALYLSLYDRHYNTIPSDFDYDSYRVLLNQLIQGVAKKNPGFQQSSIKTSDLKSDADLNMKYIDTSNQTLSDSENDDFMTVFRVDFLYSGKTLSYPLERSGIADFFATSAVRTVNSLPSIYHFNYGQKKIYVYPNPSVEGSFNIFGKKNFGEFADVDSNFPTWVTDSFLLYFEFYFAKFISANNNIPFQQEKMMLLKEYESMLDSENDNVYQRKSLAMPYNKPIRNTRIGL